ncbi:MAG: sulfatase-like hydrolase/transferase [Planctomycetota bacterium]
MGRLERLLAKGRSAQDEARPPLPPRAPGAVPGPSAAAEKPEPRADNHFVLITLDSCRYDSFVAAAPSTIPRLTGAKLERRYAYASWTAPSHYSLLTGLLPHTSPSHVYASDYYREDFHNYSARLGARDVDIDFGAFVPSLWLPTFLQTKLGYDTHARVSLPVLNPWSGINRSFDSFELMENHNDMAAMLPTMSFDGDRPQFYMLNVGETHFPYARPDEDRSDWPRVSGEGGVFQHAGDAVESGGAAPQRFDQDRLDELKERQVDTVRYLDSVFEALYDLVPKNTYVVVTADHGELFGEAGYFGHGPIVHDKCFEVPYLEGRVR